MDFIWNLELSQESLLLCKAYSADERPEKFRQTYHISAVKRKGGTPENEQYKTDAHTHTQTRKWRQTHLFEIVLGNPIERASVVAVYAQGTPNCQLGVARGHASLVRPQHWDQGGGAAIHRYDKNELLNITRTGTPAQPARTHTDGHTSLPSTRAVYDDFTRRRIDVRKG